MDRGRQVARSPAVRKNNDENGAIAALQLIDASEAPIVGLILQTSGIHAAQLKFEISKNPMCNLSSRTR